MKRRFVVLLLLCLSLSVWAGPLNDVNLSVGFGGYKIPDKELSMSYGVAVGLTQTLEADFWGISDVVPVPGRNTILGIDFGKTLVGKRSTGTRITGMNLNSVVMVGGFYSLEDNGAGVTLGITPFYAGSPNSGRREKLLTTRVGWDFVNSKLLVTMSLFDYEVCVKGRAGDYL